MEEVNGLDELLKRVDYRALEDYKPTLFSLKFVEFIKMVNGGIGEENKTPLFHYVLLDNIVNNPSTLAVSFRGSAKTSLVEYLILYLAVFGKIDGFSDISVGMYVGDTIDNGVKNMRNNLEFRYNSSEFLQKFVPKVKFTDPEWEFENADGHMLTIRGYGISTGVRGFKKYGLRPSVCHARGSVVTTDIGTHKVEDYYKKGKSFYDYGIEVSVHGLVDSEIVTEEHKFLAKELYTTRRKEYISSGKRVGNSYRYETKSTTDYMWSECGWCMAKDLAIKEEIGNQTYADTYLMKPIDYTVKNELPFLMYEKGNKVLRYKKYDFMLTNEYAWLCGYYSALGRHYLENHFGCGIKNIPDYALTMNFEWQKQLLLGYIAGDGYVTDEYVRINSVNKDAVMKLGIIAERLNLPYHIRWTRTKEFESVFPDGKKHLAHKQWEIYFRDGVKDILGFDVKPNDEFKKDVFIDNGYIIRKVKRVQKLSTLMEFIPIETPTHVYKSLISLNKNCLLDDLMSDKNAESKTVTNDIENIVYKAVRQAMHPKKRRMIWIGTPFNKRDPLYKAAGSGSWKTVVFPICEKFPCSKEEFVGAWEDRFPYSVVKSEYELLKANGRVDAFNQELMLRILSGEDRLIQDEDIVWYKRSDVMDKLKSSNVYITTDFATSETEKSDFSVISVWVLGIDGVFKWVDGVVARQDMSKNVDDLFRLCKIYNPLSVGVEVSGQQKGFVSWLKREMVIRKQFFMIASDKASGEEGLRPTTSKLTRFNTVVPLFKQRKIAFPEELRDSASMLEAIDEITSVTAGGFKSQHDDFADTVSQLQLIEWFVPMEEREKNDESVFRSKYFTISEKVGTIGSYIV